MYSSSSEHAQYYNEDEGKNINYVKTEQPRRRHRSSKPPSDRQKSRSQDAGQNFYADIIQHNSTPNPSGGRKLSKSYDKILPDHQNYNNTPKSVGIVVGEEVNLLKILVEEPKEFTIWILVPTNIQIKVSFVKNEINRYLK